MDLKTPHARHVRVDDASPSPSPSQTPRPAAVAASAAFIVMPPHEHAEVTLREKEFLNKEIKEMKAHCKKPCSLPGLWLMQNPVVIAIDVFHECVRLEDSSTLRTSKFQQWCPIRGLRGFEDFTKHALAPTIKKHVWRADGTKFIVAEISPDYEFVIGKDNGNEKVAICELQGYEIYNSAAFRRKYREHEMLLKVSRLAHDIVERSGGVS